MPTSPVERFLRYGHYVVAQWPAPVVLRPIGKSLLRTATDWPSAIGIVTYSKTPVSRVVRKVAP